MQSLGYFFDISLNPFMKFLSFIEKKSKLHALRPFLGKILFFAFLLFTLSKILYKVSKER